MLKYLSGEGVGKRGWGKGGGGRGWAVAFIQRVGTFNANTGNRQ